jgi:dephospho-CoA kinase
MARVLITGMSGAGKSSVLDILRSRGHLTVDTDYDGWTLENGLWDTERMRELLLRSPDIAVSATVENQGEMYDLFDHVVLLSAPVEVYLERVRQRTNNPYGTTPEQREEIRFYTRDVEPLLRTGATHEFDAQRSLADLADEIESLLAPSIESG